MKNGMLWIGIAVAVIGVGIAGGLLLSRGAGSAVASQAPAVGQATAPAAALSPATPGPTAVESASSPATEAAPAAVVSPTESAVAPASAAPVEVAILDLIKKQDQFAGRVVIVKGQVLAQCMAGCEFSVDDGTGTLNVKLEGDALDELIAKGSVGKKVVVTGLFVRDPRPQILLEKTGGWHFE